MIIHLLYIPDLILKLYVFIRVISLTTGKMVPSLAKAMERITNLSVIFSYFVDLFDTLKIIA